MRRYKLSAATLARHNNNLGKRPMNEQDLIKHSQEIYPHADIPLAGENCGFEVKVNGPAELRQG